MIDYSGYDEKIAIKHMRDIDKHNGYTDFMNFVWEIIKSGEIPKAEHLSVHAAKHILDYFKKKGIELDRKNYQEISLHFSGVEAAKATFRIDSDASFEEIAELSEAALAEGLKPWKNEFMKRVWEKKNKEK
jgi:hypothetical protein